MRKVWREAIKETAIRCDALNTRLDRQEARHHDLEARLLSYFNLLAEDQGVRVAWQAGTPGRYALIKRKKEK